MYIRQIAVALLCSILAAGCGSITTKYPIGTTTGLVRDEALVGTWTPRNEKTGDIERTDDGRVASYFHVLPVKSGALDIITVEFPIKRDGRGEFEVYRATSARLGGNSFLNIVLLSPPGEKFDKFPSSGTIPYLYRFEANGDLAVFRLNEEKVIAAIQSGAIAGTITERTYHYQGKDYGGHKDIEITADPMALDAFMAEPKATDLFELMGRLKKIE